LYSSSNVVTVIELKRLKQADLAARMGTMRNAYTILVGNEG
jgi:hypothetical protein